MWAKIPKPIDFLCPKDEVLSHRLGLIPLKADPRLFSWKEKTSDDEGTENDTLEFELKIKCS